MLHRCRRVIPGLMAVIMAVVLTSCATGSPAEAQAPPVDSWLQELRQEARAKGISQATLDRALSGWRPIERVLELDRRQPEFTLTFWRYMGNAVTDTRVARGQLLLAEHRALLEQVERQYGVQPRFLVAFWGLETNYGDTFGDFPVISALATLAHDRRRADFFRGELLTALEIVEAGDIPVERMEGSWAGAMGHLQFMPSTFAAYAVDADGSGRRDIWGSLPDVFASAANFLSSMGWRGDESWGLEVRLPDGFDWTLASIETVPETVLSMDEWSALGVRQADGRSLPQRPSSAALILPAGHDGPAFLVFSNYRRILNWNRSIFYAVAVGHLADRIAGGPPLSILPPSEERRLSIEEVREMQRLLGRLGFAAGPADGRIGPMTRTAIREYQRFAGLPQDAFPSPALLDRLRRTAYN